jgi:site-specific recombinase XerD
VIPRLQSTPWPERHRAHLVRYFAYRVAIASGGATTVSRLRGQVLRWSLFLAERGLDLEAATRADAVDYMATWPWSAATKRQSIYDLRALHEWLCEQGAATSNPWRGIKGPRKPHRIPRVLDVTELERIDRALARPTVRDLRDRALVSFLRATGCRIVEAQRLDLRDLDLDKREAVVTGKGDRQRIVFLDPEAVLAMRAWLSLGRHVWASSPTGPVFVGRHGQRINKTVCRDALIRAEQRAGLGRHVHPHLLRHTLATEMLENGADLRAIQEVLGHADLSTVQVYTHVARGKLREVYDRTHRPR